MTDNPPRLVPVRRFRSLRPLLWQGDRLYVSRGYTLYAGSPEKGDWQRVSRYRPPLHRGLSSMTRLGSRLRRDGFYALAALPGGGLVAILPKVIAVCPPGSDEFEVTWRIQRGTRPLAMTVTPAGHVYWGEYFSNPDRDRVHVYGSTDGARTWNVVHTFDAGAVRHVHSVTYDPHRDLIWLCTGDYGAESRVMRVSMDWKHMDTVLECTQQTRTVRPVPRPEGLYFSTDSELEQNNIYRLSDDGTLEHLCPINGPGMWSCQVDSTILFSTDVEPSKVNLDPHASVYASRDGRSWHQVVAWRKDIWPMPHFQYANIIMPRGSNPTSLLAGTGMSVRHEDDVMHVWRVE